MDVVPGDQHVALRRVRLGVQRVRHDAGHVVAPLAVHDRQVAAGVRPGVPHGVVLRERIGDQRVARIALPDVEAGVRRPARVRVVELPVLRIERVDAVVAVVVRGHVRRAEAEHARPLHAVQDEVPRRQVLDGHAIGFDHVDAVRELVLPVEDRSVAVLASDRDVWRRDDHRLVVHAGRDQDHAAGFGVIHGFLHGRIVRRHPHRRREPARQRFAARAHSTARRTRDLDVSHHHDPRHAHARRSVVLAEVRVHARLIEHLHVRRPGLQVAGIVGTVVRRDGVRAVPVVRPSDRSARLDPHDPRVERVVDRADLRVVVVGTSRERRSEHEQHQERDGCQSAHCQSADHRPGP